MMDSGEKDFIVIGVGLPRTGTFSTKEALQILLPGKCYHMFEALGKHDDFWIRMCNNTVNDEELKEFFLSKGFVASVDAPAAFFYERLMRVFPNAKFLLTTRSPDKWTSSLRGTVYEGHKYICKRQLLSSWMGPFGRLVFGEKSMHIALETKLRDYSEMLKSCGNGSGEEFFRNWNSKIMAELPKDKLLVFNVKDGWEPLCKFLNVPIPSEKFPRLNDRDSFLKLLRYFKIIMYVKSFLFWSLPLAVTGAGLYAKYF